MQAISTESAKQTIESLLIELNLSPHYKGYHYCLSALLLCLEDIHYLSGQITKTLYAKIGAQYNVSAAAVEAGIRHAVAAIWTEDNAAALDRVFGQRPCFRPSNALFLGLLTNRLHRLFTQKY